MRILLTGASGQLGKTIFNTRPKDVYLFKVLRSEYDLLDFDSCKDLIKKYKPDWIINCAAYTDVDKSETEKQMALNVNEKLPKNLSNCISQFGGKLLHISTDFVFGGDQNYPYKPTQIRNPINNYGLSKSYGELSIEKILGQSNQALIIRTSWLISPYRKNFLLTILKLIEERNEISVVYDQIGCPTSTLGLAKACWKAIHTDHFFNKEFLNDMPVPILHWSDLGVASWYDLAVCINKFSNDIGLLNKSILIKPIKSSKYLTKAKRPKYSLLDCETTYKILNIKPDHWTESLNKILYTLKEFN